VSRADHFGLAQLYQLRGRVGRSEVRAYAYLLVPGLRALSEAARRRLQALKEFTELGSGFRIAALDLEIRGAGNLLGPEQSGHIAAVGFEMYARLLERTVAEVKGEEVREEFVAEVSLPLDVQIPEVYIPEAGERLAVYKRVASAGSPERVERVVEEVVDRYGGAPAQLRNLATLGRVKALAERLRVASVEGGRSKLVLRFAEGTEVDPEDLVALVRSDGRYALKPEGVLEVKLPSGADPAAEACALLARLG
jgi:transcription-repair coupling factor (superfamily II helicase)